MRGQSLIAAAVIMSSLAFAQPAAAQNYGYGSYHDEHVARQEQCRQSRQNRTVGGALIGGIAGALLGREVADRGVRGEGAALGAVVGAAAGGAIGRNSADCDTRVQGSYDPYYGQSQDPYYNDGYSGGPYRETYYGGNDCRVSVETAYDRYGRPYREEVTFCRDRDGRWRAVD